MWYTYVLYLCTIPISYTYVLFLCAILDITKTQNYLKVCLILPKFMVLLFLNVAVPT